jgi:uncharacterized phiE125 gp8 family phage protein
MIKVTSAPASEPLTLAEVKLWLKIESGETVEDTLLNSLIEAARTWVELHCNIAILPQTITESYDFWLRTFPMQRGPVTAVNSIKYFLNTSLTTYTDTQVDDLYSTPARVMITGTIPQVDASIGVVRIEYVAGYADIAEIPETLRLAMLYKVGSMYVNRADYAQRYLNASLSLLGPFKNQYARTS